MPGAGRVERGLVHAQHLDRPDTVGVIHQRGAVLADGVLDCPPADPVLAGDRRHRTGLLADLTTCLDSARRDIAAVAQNNSSVSVHVLTEHHSRRRTPAALPHDKANRATETGQIADLTIGAVLRLGSFAAPAAPCRYRGRLDRHDQLTIGLDGLEHGHAIEADQQVRESVTFRHVEGSLQMQCRNRNCGRALGTLSGSPRHPTAPHQTRRAALIALSRNRVPHAPLSCLAIGLGRLDSPLAGGFLGCRSSPIAIESSCRPWPTTVQAGAVGCGDGS